MKLLDKLSVGMGNLELYYGDLTDMHPGHKVDVLVISAYPNNYSTSSNVSLLKALKEKGISVAQLAKNKAYDLRDPFDCWLSQPLQQRPAGIQFERILAFEPLQLQTVHESIGGIFQSLMPFINDDPFIRSVAMPLVSTGTRRGSVEDVFEGLFEAAYSWLSLGLPLEKIKLVERDQLKAYELKGAFAMLRRHADELYSHIQAQPLHTFTYDAFISYSHQDTEAVQALVQEMQRLRPKIKLFIDRQTLDTGAAWQQRIYEALDDCYKVIPIYSPTYLESKVCLEEFHIGLLRHRKMDKGTLLPIYLRDANLPSYMELIQFEDCREANADKLLKTAATLVKKLSS